MALNPFLSADDVQMAAQIPTESLNPFFFANDDQMNTSNDNPFTASNPFSEFGSSFYDSNIVEPHNDIFGVKNDFIMPEVSQSENTISFNENDTIFNMPDYSVKPTELNLIPHAVDLNSILSSDEDSPVKPKRPPPPKPLPPETKNLILSVTGQMDYASSHLLDRIPPTRTPSPVSMRDLHSPSPTPDYTFGEMLSDSEQGVNSLESFSSNPIEGLNEDSKIHTIGFETNLTSSLKTMPEEIQRTEVQNKPSRPARPTPPARPQPPNISSSDILNLSQNEVQNEFSLSKDEDINLFDAPTLPLGKPSNEAILSLYSAPKVETKQIDFLSDDILDNIEIPVQQTESLDTENEISADINLSSVFDNVASVTDTQAHDKINDNDSQAQLFSHTIPEEILLESNPLKINMEEQINPFDVSSSKQNHFDHAQDMVCEQSVPNNFEDLVDKNEKVDLFFSTTQGVSINSEAFDNFIDTMPSSVPDQHPIQNMDAFSGFGEPAATSDVFDAFSAKFDALNSDMDSGSAWGDKKQTSETTGFQATNEFQATDGFEADGSFDAFLTLGDAPPAPTATPANFSKEESQESDDENFSVFIKPKSMNAEVSLSGETPILAPPPRPSALPDSPRFNPFDKTQPFAEAAPMEAKMDEMEGERKQSGAESPPTPLFDEDVSQPLEDFPRTRYEGPGWEMQLRQPNKKKITGQRFWKKILVKLAYQGDNPVVQLYNSATDKEPFQELPLQACYSVSEIGAQQYDQFGKIFTVKLQYVFYKERPGVRPGQVTKAERITNKLSQFAAYAIQGDYQGVKEFGSDLKKLGLPVEHAPQISQLFKVGSLSYEDVKQFSVCIEEALFRLNAHRDRALVYKMEEVQITAVDELYVEQDAEGCVLKQIARVRLFFLGFLTGMPDIELGVNDMRRQGREVVGRHDIIPVVTEEWIRVEDVEFHACVQPEEFYSTKIIKFKPPDACYIELIRFRIRPPKNRELPLQLKAVMCVTGNKVELRADVLVPGFASRKLGQVPCEDVAIRFPIPECWIYLFRVEKHFRYGSVKSAHRRTGKIKGIERFLGTVETLQESLIEVTSGQAKYEHQHRAIVWRMPRLPKEGQGAYTTHNLVCRMALTSYDQVPPELAKWAYVEFTMPATQASHVTVRSVSLQNHDSDEPPEKYVRYLARHEYKVGIEHTTGSSTAAYVAAAAVTTQPAPAPQPTLPTVPQAPSSDSDSD